MKICWKRDRLPTPVFLGFPCGSAGKESACNSEDLGSIPGLGRSPGEGKGYPLQYSGPGEFHGQRSLTGYSPWGHRVSHNWATFTFMKIYEYDFEYGFRKGRGTRDQIANICWIIGKARELKKIYFCFIDYVKAFDCVDHNKLWNILNEMGIPDHLTCLLRNLYAEQETTIRTGHGTTTWFQIGKGVNQGCILSPCLFNLYAE